MRIDLSDTILKTYTTQSTAHHSLDSSYFKVDGMDTRADSMFLNGPPLALHSICIIPKLIEQEIRQGDNFNNINCCLSKNGIIAWFKTHDTDSKLKITVLPFCFHPLHFCVLVVRTQLKYICD